jgi:hypothetical protein
MTLILLIQRLVYYFQWAKAVRDFKIAQNREKENAEINS